MILQMEALDVIVIGGGIVGLASAAHLRGDGLRIAVLERAGEVGGTWRDHDYPGCGADTEASTYVPLLEPLFSKKRFATRAELFEYCKFFARKHVGLENIRLNHSVVGASFDSKDHLWHIATNRGVLRARFVIWANFSGADVTKAKRPVFEGQEQFQGTIVHASELPNDPGYFRNKRVAIVGCGATSVQLVPSIADAASRITLISRTTPYIKKTRMTPGPKSLLGYRLQGAVLRCKNEIISIFDSHPHLEALYRWPYRFREYVLKRDGMPAAAIPPLTQPVQCTRRGYDYLGFRNSLKRPDVDFVSIAGSSGIERYTPDSLIVNGKSVQADIVVLATGYHMAEIAFDISVDGEIFNLDPHNIRGLYGVIDGLPNSLLAIFGSPLWIIPPRLAEFNTKTFLKLVRHMRRNGLTCARINSGKAAKMTAMVQKLNRKHIVLQPDCPSYRYLLSNTGQESAGQLPSKTAANLPFLPFPSIVMELITRLTFSPRDFDFSSLRQASSGSPTAQNQAGAKVLQDA